MLNDAEDGFATFLQRGSSVCLTFHSSWSRRPQKELERQQAYLRGQREKPQDLVQTISTEKMAGWETMHDKIYDFLLEAESRSTGFDAEIDMYKRSLEEALQVSFVLTPVVEDWMDCGEWIARRLRHERIVC